MRLTTYCFDEPGPQNTDETLEIALERAQALGITQAVVASSHGDTARRAHDVLAPHGIRIIVVTLCHGFEDLGWCMSEKTKEELRGMGLHVVTGIHALGDGVGAAFSETYGGRTIPEIVRDTLYRFCQGMKVAVECVLMAADAGHLNMDEEVISIAGTGSGADTAIVCKPAYPRSFFDLEIREVLAKPRIP
ncbi:MAG: pyruvate kinase alpha/beta domain-containing protein [Chloroflexota bacterium]|nr:pyruvate kinase alpha/beta domain-containing protein [Chloroflexota bacterium]